MGRRHRATSNHACPSMCAQAAGMDINVPDNTINKGEPAHACLAAVAVMRCTCPASCLNSLLSISSLAALLLSHSALPAPCLGRSGRVPAPGAAGGSGRPPTPEAAAGGQARAAPRAAVCLFKGCTSDGSLPNMAVADRTQVKRTVHSLRGFSLPSHVAAQQCASCFAGSPAPAHRPAHRC